MKVPELDDLRFLSEMADNSSGCQCAACLRRHGFATRMLAFFTRRGISEEEALLEACKAAQIVVGAPEEFLAPASETAIREAICEWRGVLYGAPSKLSAPEAKK